MNQPKRKIKKGECVCPFSQDTAEHIGHVLICPKVEEWTKKYWEKERGHLKYELHKLDWIKILDNAIKSRPTSWGEHPIREYRNAADTICFALVNEMKLL